MGDILTKACFSPLSRSHIAKPCLSVVLKHFEEIHRELLFLFQKITISERSIEKLRNLFFLTSLIGVNPEEN